MFGKARQKAKEAAEVAAAKAKEVDEKYKVSEKASAGAGMAAAGVNSMAAAGAERAKEAREVAAAKAERAREAAEDALGKAPAGVSMGTVVLAAPPGSERDALVRMFRAVPGGHFDVVDCGSMEEAKEELQIRGPGTGHPLRAVIVRGDLPARSKAVAPAGVAAVAGGGVVFNFDSPTPPAQESLPAGWEIRDSTQYFMEDGVTPRKFFFNTQTNETSWERPKPPALAAGDDGSDDGSAVALLEWFSQLMIGQTAEIPCVMAVAAVNVQALKQRAGLKVAQAKNFASFDQFNADMATKTEEEKQVLVAELNAALQEDVKAAKQLRDAQAAKAKEAGAVTLWPTPTEKERVDQLARHLINIEQRRQRIARQAFGATVPLKVWTCTFNIACERAPFELGPGGNVEATLSTFVPKDHDVYVVGVQEGMGDGFFQGMAEYLDSFGVQLITGQGKGFGPRIEGRGDGSLMSTKYTGIAAFAKKALVDDGHVKVKREVVHEFKGEEGKLVKDMKESLGSKGGAALAIQCFDTTLAVISVHMAKEWHKVAKKRAQYRELSDQLGRKLGDANYQLHSQFHHAIWMGDFNYHIGSEEVDPDKCMKAIAASASTWDSLGEHDEMRKEMEGGHVYVGFNEPEKTLDFHPSYKKKVPRAKSDYTTGETWVSACYDINFKQQWYKGGKVKLRMPSWTDRILYASLVAKAGSSATRLEPLMDQDFMSMGAPLYQAANDVLLCSDHSPVHASFALTALNQRLEPKEERQFRYKVEILEVTLVHPGGTPPAAVEQTAVSTPDLAEGDAAPPTDLLSVPAPAPAPTSMAVEPVDECEETPDKVLALVPAPWEGIPDRKPECKNPPPAAPVQGQQQGNLLPGSVTGTEAAPVPDLLSMPAPAAAPASTQPQVDLLGMGAPQSAVDATPGAAGAGEVDLLGLPPAPTAAVAGGTMVASSGLSADDARNNVFRFVGGDVGSASTEHHICLKVMRKVVHPLTGEEVYEAAEAAFAIKLPVAPPAADPQQVDLLGGAAAAGQPEPIRETLSGVLLAQGMPWFGGKGGGPTSARVVVETSLEPIGEGM
eukprot:COSAG02_NODE_2968_length_7640_cov_10.957831_3_plen_1065_part_00